MSGTIVLGMVFFRAEEVDGTDVERTKQRGNEADIRQAQDESTRDDPSLHY